MVVPALASRWHRLRAVRLGGRRAEPRRHVQRRWLLGPCDGVVDPKRHMVRHNDPVAIGAEADPTCPKCNPKRASRFDCVGSVRNLVLQGAGYCGEMASPELRLRTKAKRR